MRLALAASAASIFIAGCADAARGPSADAVASDSALGETVSPDAVPPDSVPTDAVPTDAVHLSGTLTCEACTGPIALVAVSDHMALGAPLYVVHVEAPGVFDVLVPRGLGPVELVAFDDPDRDGKFASGAPFGSAEPLALTIGDTDLVDIPVVLAAPPPTPENGLLDEHGDAILPGRVLVGFHNSVVHSDAEAAIAAAGGTLIGWLRAGALVRVATTPDAVAALQAFEAAIGASPGTAFVLRDYVVAMFAARDPDDNQSLAETAGKAFTVVGASVAKDLFDACAYRLEPEDLFREITVCVADHDLQGARDSVELKGLVAAFEDVHTHATQEFCGKTANGFDRPCEANTTDHHGSAVSHVVAALVNGKGMNGLLSGFTGTGFTELSAFDLTPSLRLYNVGHGPTGSGLDILTGLEHAAAAGCTVVNLSMSSKGSGVRDIRGYFAARASFEKVLDAFPDTLFVVAAGNDHASLNGVLYWQSLRKPNLLVAGATDDLDQAAWFTNFGQGKIDLAAPGVKVPSHLVDVRHTGTVFFPTVETKVIDAAGTRGDVDGTSFSSPLIAAAAGWLRAFEPGLSPAAVKSRLRSTADPISVANLDGRRLSLRRLVTDVVAARIATATTHVLTFDLNVTFSGDAACQQLDGGFGQPCVPLIVTGGAVSIAPGTRDMGGNVVALSGTLGNNNQVVDLTISGAAMTPGIGPATTRLTGTATAVAGDPGDFMLSGTVSGGAKKSEGAPNECQWTGTFTGRLYGRSAD